MRAGKSAKRVQKNSNYSNKTAYHVSLARKCVSADIAMPMFLHFILYVYRLINCATNGSRIEQFSFSQEALRSDRY